MRHSEKIERLQPFVSAILGSENQYVALMYGLVIQIKPHPVWGPIWQQQRGMSGPDIMDRLRPDPVFGGIVLAIDAEVARKANLYVDALKAIGDPKGSKAIKALELIESLLTDRQRAGTPECHVRKPTSTVH